MIAAGRGRRVLEDAAGFLGAEILGALCVLLTAVLFANGWNPMVIVGMVLIPVVFAAAGPSGYDMALSWVPKDERPDQAPRGSRAAVHAAGVAGALLVALACWCLASALDSPRSLILAILGTYGLPVLAEIGRRLALRAVKDDPPVLMLPVSLVVVVVAGVGLLLAWGSMVSDS